MPLAEDRLQKLLKLKENCSAGTPEWGESWAIIDGALVIHDGERPPYWVPTLEHGELNDNGETLEFEAAFKPPA